MRSITLNTCRAICINQHAKHGSKYGYPCNDCCIVGICMLFVKQPINWSEYSIEDISKESEAFYKLKKEGTNGKV